MLRGRAPHTLWARRVATPCACARGAQPRLGRLRDRRVALVVPARLYRPERRALPMGTRRGRRGRADAVVAA
eukprot:751652-Prymnesium_polylepis.1